MTPLLLLVSPYISHCRIIHHFGISIVGLGLSRIGTIDWVGREGKIGALCWGPYKLHRINSSNSADHCWDAINFQQSVQWQSKISADHLGCPERVTATNWIRGTSCPSAAPVFGRTGSDIGRLPHDAPARILVTVFVDVTWKTWKMGRFPSIDEYESKWKKLVLQLSYSL
jgi:hypothetical protein